MALNLTHLEQRVKELETLADEVLDLGQRLSCGEDVQSDLSVQGQRWYRGARELLVQQNFSGLREFDHCYTSLSMNRVNGNVYGIRGYISGKIDFISAQHRGECFAEFSKHFRIARSLLRSL